MIIGLGVNIAKFPKENMLYPTTSLKEEGVDMTVEIFLEQFIAIFEKQIHLFKEKGFDLIRQEWLSHARNLGQGIILNLSDKIVRGIFKDIDQTGALLLEADTGKIEKITVGDMSL